MVDVDESRDLVYVTNAMFSAGDDQDRVSVIDETTIGDGISGNEVIETLTLEWPPPPHPPYFPGGWWGIHVCEYHQVIWVTASNWEGVLAFDGYSYDLMPEGEVRLHFTPGDNAVPYAVDVDEIRSRVYVADGAMDDVDVIDEYKLVDGIMNNAVIDSIDVGHGPFGIAVDEPRNRVYVANQLDGTVSVIDGSKVGDKISGNEVIDTITVGNEPLGIAVDETNNRIYVTNNGDNTVSVIDGYLVEDGIPGNEVTTVIAVGTHPAGVAVSDFYPPPAP